MASTRTLRWGILGCGRLLGKLADAIRLADGAELVAVASRDASRARAAAKELDVPRAYGSYGALLDDPNVDIIHNALHNGLHCEWTVRALAAGKHVLCEKPLACSAAEAEQMFAAAHAHSRLLMEAFMYRFHPQIALAKAIVDRGDIGALTHVRCAYSGRGREPDNPRYWKDAGGGALMDLGCYCVNLARMFAGGEPQRVRADAKFDKRTGVDMEFSATLEFANKIEAQLHCGFAANKPAYAAHVQGASGALEIPHPWQPPRWPAEISVIRGGKTQTIRVEDQRGPQHVLAPFAREIEHFTACVREGRRPTFPPDVDAERDSLGNMRAMDALLASARVLP